MGLNMKKNVCMCIYICKTGLPGSSAGKESACNAGDLGSIPGLGRSPGEGNAYPFQYSGLENSMDCIVQIWITLQYSRKWPSLAAHRVKNLPATQGSQVWLLGREGSPEKGMATHSNILAWRIPWTEELHLLFINQLCFSSKIKINNVQCRLLN